MASVPRMVGVEGEEDLGRRYREGLARALGEGVMRGLGDPDVTEVYVNPSGRVYFDTRSEGRRESGEEMGPEQVLRFLHLVASGLATVLTTARPLLQAELPRQGFAGARVQGFVPPVAAAPCFNIRKPPAVIYTLDEYVAAGSLARAHQTALGAAVLARKNLLVVGGTSSGKTTLANALLHEITTAFPRERIVILEDTVELQCAAPDHLALRTSDTLKLKDLVKAALRTSPDRIVVGEVRDEAALDLLDAWETGHPGGCATLHAEDALGALHRLDRLAQRNNVGPQPHLVGSAIDLIVVIAGGSRGRRVTELVKVGGFEGDSYRLTAISAT
ncbi:MAG TPA: P-type conjugative transfer ATPase TrbB [Thermoanaerobaculia bacterium]|nr:P-type conjugative transfer ATPase TrbB [Thermoanaerobaculia bacterium]